MDRAELAAVSGKVTDLSPQNREPRRRSVYVDGRFVLGLHEEALLQEGIRTGLAVDGAQLVRAYDRDQLKAARDSALALLAMAPRSEREVAKRLLPRFGAEVAEAVVAWLVAGGWLSDADFARAYIRSHGTFGARRLAAELARRSVARDVVQEAIRELLGESDVLAAARSAAATRLSRMPGVDRDTAQRRLSGFLARRGYDFTTVAEALAPLLVDLPRPPRPQRQGSTLRRSRPPRRAVGRADSTPEEGV